jgi:hypothetical protein
MKKSILIALGSCFVTLPAIAAQHCTQETTRGTWEYTCEGLLSPAVGVPLQPTRLLGTCSASSTAHWDCLGSANIGGFVVDQGQVLRGDAVNNRDCTGEITYADYIFGTRQPDDIVIRYVIRDNGDKINGLPISPNQVLSCVLNRMSN